MPDPPARARLDAVDALRGLAIVLMALDHARSLLMPGLHPEDLDTTTPLFFAVRWITHLCAPTFVLLAGLGAALHARRAGVDAARRFLAVRGLLLVVLEVTVVSAAWQFAFSRVYLLVLWALGASMILLALLARRPRWLPGVLGLAIVALQPLWGGTDPATLGPLATPFALALGHGRFDLPGGLPVHQAYAALPWFGVMALGWSAAPWLAPPDGLRPGRLAIAGGALLVAFLALRISGIYGDPSPWEGLGADPVRSLLSLGRVSKYPPSPQFLLLTLGAALLLLSAAARRTGRGLLAAYGRAPLAFYLLHIPVLHALAIVHTRVTGSHAPTSLGFALVAWVAVTAALLPACRAWDRVRARHAWARYL